MLTTLPKIKSYLGLEETINHDELLNVMISNLSSFIENYIDRKIEQDEFTEYFDGERELFVSNYPVVSAVVSYNAGTQATPNWQVIDEDNYNIDYQSGLIRGAFPGGFQNIKVVYTGGFDAVPGDLEQLANELVAREFEQRKAQGKTRENYNGMSIDWRAGMTPLQKAILDKYRGSIL